VHEIEPAAKSDVAEEHQFPHVSYENFMYTEKKMVRKVISACN